MPCYRPQPAQQAYNFLSKKWSKPRLIYPVARDADGARHFEYPLGDFSSLVHKHQEHKFICLPCGKCNGCRLDNTRMWALRMMHQARYSQWNYFITLTYAPESLPPGADLRYRDLNLFFKSARHCFQTSILPFKYFACGEYGDKNFRPHYHFAAFDFKIDDLRPLPSNPKYFISDSLRSVWKHGHVLVAALEWDSASYIARYVTKKMHGKNIRERFDPLTGEIEQFVIERAFQSKGLGLPWYEDHQEEVWRLDGCLFKNKYMIKPPRYYFKKLSEFDPDKALQVKLKRQEDRPPERLDYERDKQLLYEMEAVRLQLQTLKRSL